MMLHGITSDGRMGKMLKKKMFISFLLAFFVCSFGFTIKAQATTKTADEGVKWAQSMVGYAIDKDGVYGAQCVDLIMAYYEYLGVSRVGGNGADYATNSLPSGWQRIKGAQPQKGDILVYYGTTDNPYGHVAIYEADKLHYDQNVIVNGNIEQWVHKCEWHYNYTGNYWGVIRPNWSQPTPPPTPDPDLPSDATSVEFAMFLSGFDKSHSLYQKYNNIPLPSYDKEEMIGWIYWHWAATSGTLPNNNYNCFISDENGWDGGRNYQYFTAFFDTTDYGHTDPNGRSGGECFYAWRGYPSDGSWWWFRTPVYRQTKVPTTYHYNIYLEYLNTTIQTKTINGKEKIESLPTPSKSGYTFLGWYTEKDGGTKIIENYHIFNNNFTLYAHWEKEADPVNHHTVTFDPNGGVCETYSLVTETYETYEILRWMPTPSLSGKKFIGWYTKNGQKVGTNANYLGNVTLYAHWEAVSTEYTITFDPNGGDGDKYQKTTQNQKITGYGTPTHKNGKYDYEFVGWYTKKIDGDKCSTNTVYNNNVTLYAHWKPVMPVINDFTLYYHGFGELDVSIDTSRYKAMKYEIQYSTSTKKNKLAKAAKSVIMSMEDEDSTVTIKGLKYGYYIDKTYYIRVRTITTNDDGYTYTSEWGNWKKVHVWALAINENW